MRRRTLCFAVAALILIALAANAYFTADMSGRTLVFHKSGGGLSTRAEAIEEQNGGAMLTTYELAQVREVSALQTSAVADVVGTNPLYAAVTGHRMLSGGFFTEGGTSWGAKHMVLNEPLARTLFGGLSIVGETAKLGDTVYQITGVIDDGYDDERAYIPLTDDSLSPESLLLLSREGMAYIIAALKECGLSESTDAFVDIGAYSRALWDKALAGLYALLFTLVLCIQKSLIRQLQRHIGAWREALSTRYALEAVKKAPGTPLRLTLSAAGVAASAALMLALILMIFSRYLQWAGGAEALSTFRADAFAPIVESLLSAHTRADAGLIACAASLVVGVVGGKRG